MNTSPQISQTVETSSLLTKEGFEVRHECFEHAPASEPEEVIEE